MGTTSVLIFDGYNLDGKIPARPGHWPEIKFRYRPALAEELWEFHRTEEASGEQRMKATAKFLMDHLISWDITVAGGNETVPITAANLRRVPAQILARFIDHVAGYVERGEAETDAKN
jgi:hypothetical protein